LRFVILLWHGDPSHRSLSQVPGSYAAFVEELPGAKTQGVTLDEPRENLKEAVSMVLQADRDLAEEWVDRAKVVREPLALKQSCCEKRSDDLVVVTV
jgi:predicted RNase H-like HicB family nuclease